MNACGCAYFNSLEFEDQNEYSKKLETHEIPCPYCLVEWDSSVTSWPALTYLDIVNYLIFEKDRYTLQEFQAYKSLNSYQIFAEGRVKEIVCHVTENRNVNCVLKATVQASQKKDKWLEPWVCISQQGKINTAHCTCMAGIAGVCSHVAGVLFKINHAYLAGYLDEAVTSKACAWNQFYKDNVVPEIAENLVYDNATHSSTRKRKRTALPSSAKVKRVVAPFTEHELAQKIQKLHEIAPDAVWFGGKEYSTTDSGSEVGEDLTLPPVMLNYFVDLDENDDEELIVETSCNLLSNLTASKNQCLKLFSLTKDQSKCKIWSEFRQGRVTGSTCHSVFKIRDNTSRDSILKELIWSDPRSKANIPAIKWGREHEDIARDHYTIRMKMSHRNFRVEEAGFMVSHKYPYIGATPDGTRICSCHGRGTLEIKCPYKYKNDDIHSSTSMFSTDSSFCLDKKGNFKTSHKWYTQVQLQMYVMDVMFSDFVVWTTKGFRTLSVTRDDEFCKKLIKSIQSFASEYLAPELVARRLR